MIELCRKGLLGPVLVRDLIEIDPRRFLQKCGEKWELE